MAAMEEELFSLYLESPDGFSTAKRLWSGAKGRGLRVSQEQVQEFMDGWETATRFRRKYKKPKLRDRVFASAPFDLFQVDLAFLPKYRGFIGFLIA
jgi:hypothetical protein